MKLGAPFALWALAFAFTVIAKSTLAEVTPADLQIAARALSFMTNPPSGNVRLGIVYVPNNSHSVQEADAVAHLLGNGLRVGNLVFVPVLASVNDLLNAPVDLFFLPEGLGETAQPLVQATKTRKLPCVTSDLSQVESGRCELGVSALPKVRIYLSRTAAANSSTSFTSVFRMMVTEF